MSCWRRCIFVLFVACTGLVSTAYALEASRTSEKISLDGLLDEKSWRTAKISDQFFENTPRDKQQARVRTEVRAIYDGDALYVAIQAYDPSPNEIVAPLVRRDKVFGAQDYFMLLIDPTGSKKFAQFFRVNVQGALADGVWNEDQLAEDFSPDFDFEATSRRSADGWSAEFRIPWTSLRLPNPLPTQLNFIAFRIMPRDETMRMSNAPLGREPVCYLCVAEPLTGIQGIRSAAGYSVSPFFSINLQSERRGNSSAKSSTEFLGGFDLKWRVNPTWILDATYRPDFSQIELDAPQLRANTRFALSVQEKRPFFLEGSDLFAMPYDTILYTRSITDPLWGARATARSPDFDVTAVAVSDKGGGLRVVPNTYFSQVVAQPSSEIAFARIRAPAGEFGSLGGTVSYRSYGRGMDNSVMAIDGVLKPNDETRIRAQALGSQTVDSVRTYGHAAFLDGIYDNSSMRATFKFSETSPSFRADTSIVTQNGVRSTDASFRECFERENFVSRICPGISGYDTRAWNGNTISRTITPFLSLFGDRSLEVNFEPRFFSYNRIQSDGALHHTPTMYLSLRSVPNTVISRVSLNTEVGRTVDTTDDLVAKYSFVGADIGTRLLPRLELDLNLSEQRLHSLDTNQLKLREFAGQAIMIGHISSKNVVRFITQFSQSRRELPETSRSHTSSLAHSLVFTHRRTIGKELNIGLTQSTVRSDVETRKTIEVFVKLSYAFNF
jgi:Domain of unknown function (DUF5916)